MTSDLPVAFCAILTAHSTAVDPVASRIHPAPICGGANARRRSRRLCAYGRARSELTWLIRLACCCTAATTWGWLYPSGRLKVPETASRYSEPSAQCRRKPLPLVTSGMAGMVSPDSRAPLSGDTMPAIPLVTRGNGLRLHCADGSEYLDAVSGTFNLPLGYNHPHVVAAVQQQASLMSHVSSDLARPYAQSLLDRLLALAPPQIGAGWIRDATGSTAVECAVKIAQKATGKSDVITLFHGHHGQTALTTSMSGPAWRREGFPLQNSGGILRVPEPN